MSSLVRGAFVCTSLVAVCAAQNTLIVPTQHPTIQAAIVAAIPGDTVLVLPGSYVENIDFLGKAITVRSSAGAAVTTIDGNQAGTVVSFVTGEPLTAILEGFTVTNGLGAAAGGVLCINASPTIRACSITGNVGGPAGPGGAGGAGGVHATGSALRMTDVVVAGNLGGAGAMGGAGGAYFAPIAAGPVLERCRFDNNSGGVGTGSGRGGCGGLEMYSLAPTSSFTRCRFTNNQGGNGGASPGGTGGFDVYGPSAFVAPVVTLTNCIVVGNTGGNGTIGGSGGAFAQRGIVNFQAFTTTIAGNATGTPGGAFGQSTGGLAVGGWQVSSATLRNCIVWGNTLNGAPSDVYSNGIATSAGSCDIGATMGTVFGTGNLSVDPLFVNLAAGDVHLTAGSPCRHTGSPLGNLPLFDFEGDPRVIGPVTDIGADEFELLPGSREDIALAVTLNGTAPAVITPVAAPAASVVGINVRSPAGTLAAGFTMIGLEPWLPPAAPVGPPLLPELHLSGAASVLVVFATGVGPLGVNLPVTIPPGLTGIAVRLQAFVLTPTASNGSFAATAARDVVL